MTDAMTGRQKALVMFATMLGLFTAAMDQTVVNTAIPKVIADLGGLNIFSWVFTAYMLTSVITVPIAGKLSDIYGRKVFLVAGLLIFMLTSAGAGEARSMTQLIFLRGIQGIGAGMILSNAFAVIGDLFSPLERARWQGVATGTFGLASVIGPFIGGFLTDNLSWRWVFYVNVPIGIVTIIALMRFLPAGLGAGAGRKIDYIGVVLLIVGLVPLLLASVWGGVDYAWTSPLILSLLAASFVAIGVFVWWEVRVPEPIIPLQTLFSNNIIAVLLILAFFSGAALFGTTAYLPLFVQGVIGSSATDSGLVLMPQMVSMVVVSIIGGNLIGRTGKYRWLMILGSFAMAAGMFLLSRVTVHSTNSDAILAMIIVGIGMGVAMPTTTLVAQNAGPQAMIGAITSSVVFFRQMGGVLGIALLGTLLNNRLAHELDTVLSPDVSAAIPADRRGELVDPRVLLEPSLRDQAHSILSAASSDGETLFQQFLEAMRIALAHSLATVFVVTFVLMVIASIVTLFLKEIPLRRSNNAEVSHAIPVE